MPCGHGSSTLENAKETCKNGPGGQQVAQSDCEISADWKYFENDIGFQGWKFGVSNADLGLPNAFSSRTQRSMTQQMCKACHKNQLRQAALGFLSRDSLECEVET